MILAILPAALIRALDRIVYRTAKANPEERLPAVPRERRRLAFAVMIIYFRAFTAKFFRFRATGIGWFLRRAV